MEDKVSTNLEKPNKQSKGDNYQFDIKFVGTNNQPYQEQQLNLQICITKTIMNPTQTTQKLNYNQDTETSGLQVHNDPIITIIPRSHIPHPIISEERTTVTWVRRF